MYKQKKIIVIVPAVDENGRLIIGNILQNDFDCDLKIVGNGGENPGDPGYYYLMEENDAPIFAGYDIAQINGFCNLMSNSHVYMIVKDPDPTETKAAIIVLDDPNGNAVDGSFGVYSPALIFECYPI